MGEIENEGVAEETLSRSGPTPDAFFADSEVDAASIRGRQLTILSSENQSDTTRRDDENDQSFD